MEDDLKDADDIKRAKKIIEDLDSSEPLSACGMFQITRGTLTSMIFPTSIFLHF